MMRQAALPGHEALLKTLKSEGKILAGGYCWREGYSVYRRVRFFQGARRVNAVHTFLEIVKTKVTPLQEFEDRHDQDRQATEQMEQSLQR